LRACFYYAINSGEDDREGEFHVGIMGMVGDAYMILVVYRGKECYKTVNIYERI
jgi:hypothetical protein